MNSVKKPNQNVNLIIYNPRKPEIRRKSRLRSFWWWSNWSRIRRRSIL